MILSLPNATSLHFDFQTKRPENLGSETWLTAFCRSVWTSLLILFSQDKGGTGERGERAGGKKSRGKDGCETGAGEAGAGLAGLAGFTEDKKWFTSSSASASSRPRSFGYSKCPPAKRGKAWDGPASELATVPPTPAAPAAPARGARD